MRKRAQLFFFLLISALLAFHPSSLQAQTTAGAIRGVVTDEANAVLPGATVTVTNISTGISRSVTTDEAGRYAFLGLPAAPYTLKAELQGFTPTVRQRIELAVGQTVEINFTLKVAGIQEEVMVTAEAPVINRETPELGGRMNPKSLLDLPINGRDYARFALLVPGAIARSNYIADLTFNGLHTVHNTFTIDGIDASRVDQPYMANGYERGARLLTGSLDSIQEFRVNTGIYQAEFGRASGSVINIVSKSGGNEVHGTLFEFLRNSVFDAKNFFLKPDQPKPLYILNQFGGNVSGPIVKNKTFYFMNYEGSRQRIGITGTGTVPSQALRQRVLATSPALAPLLATIPLGTSPTSNPDVDSYTTVKTSAVREDTGSIKVDHRFSDKDLFFARYNLNDTRVFGALFGVFPTALAKDQFQDVPVRTTNIALQEQHIFSSRMINEFKAGMQRWASQIISNTPFPLTTITGLTIQPGTRGRSLLNGTSFQWIDNFSVTHGEHSFKAGVEIRRVHINNRTMNTSTMIYASIEDFVKNSVSSASLTPGNPGRGTRGTQYGAYFQDDIRPASNVTLNLGIRYEYYSVLHEVLNRTTPYNLLRGDLDPPGSPYYHPDRNNFAPRFGFSWSPWGSAKTVLRGGVGIYFQAYPTGFGAYRVPLNNIPGATTLLRSQIPNLSFPLEPFIASGTTPLPNVAGFDPFRRDIYTEQWTLNIQRELGQDMVFQIAYVGNHGVNLRRDMNINFFDPDLGRRPNTKFADIYLEGNTGLSIYHAMQVSFRRRFSKGLAFDLEYTYGHAIDDVQDQGLWSAQPQDNKNFKAERGNSSGDIRHNVAFNFSYDLPFGPGRSLLGSASGFLGRFLEGWQLNGLGILHTGIPFTVELGGNSRGNFNFTNQRPDRVLGVSSKPAKRTIDNWLNRDAFAEPKPGTFGNLGRNTEYGPGFAQIDFSILKTTKLRETHTLQFRAEFFNIFNHPNFANPVAQYRNVASFGKVLNTFGRTIGMGTPRQIQFALKYTF